MSRVFLIIPLLSIAIASCGRVDSLSPKGTSTIVGYAGIDDQVKNLPANVSYNVRYYPNEQTLKALVVALIGPGFSTQRNSKILHDWISTNIMYDIYAFNNGITPAPFALDVLSRREAVCQGYAGLFYKMATLAGLTVSAVTGADSNNHIWNAVQDGGVWKHIDSTWDAGFQNADLTWSQSYRTTYFYQSETDMSSVTEHAMNGSAYKYDQAFTDGQ